MTGVQFLIDAKGNKTAAVIDLKVHKALWEDIQDILVSNSRHSEHSIQRSNLRSSEQPLIERT